MKKILVALLILLCTTSCATQQFRTAETNPDSVPRTYDSSQKFFLYGIGQTQEISASRVCDNNRPAEVANKLSPLDAVIGLAQRLIFLEVYSPRTTSVTCE